ncbi:tumor necrosis factor receptor superfamily member 16-like [Cottoperca gobio]|uniref:Tumor necrosis factor receptor superfamily member 16-like n=1 Tax=Cottoperca gobio TaxID=56716 RepID=A0A6J2QCD4_COTGO|nr:tumor necrosis factor receptor superfamily member 16-like [Cottoperca gobio]
MKFCRPSKGPDPHVVVAVAPAAAVAPPISRAALCFWVWFFFLLHYELTDAFPQSDLDCRDDEYKSGSLCCLNCPAGTRTTSPCRTGVRGQCEECDDGTFTAYGNGLKHCFKCIQCRPDEEAVSPCTHTQDAQCRCKSGRFCDPNEPCEVCKKCTSCGEDEETVRNCTSTTNRECKKVQTKSDSASANPSMIGLLCVLAVLVIVVLIAVLHWVKRRRRASDSPRNLPEDGKAGQNLSDSGPTDGRRQSCSNLIPVRIKSSVRTEDEREVLCESLSSSSSNSQHSLTGLYASASSAPPPPSHPHAATQAAQHEGEESLRQCFLHFEDIDFDLLKRFFRQLEISDNVIKSKDKEQIPYEDKIHDLLNIWVEKEGRCATLNNLLKALLDLNQRRTAEIVRQKALDSGHYTCEG